MATDRIAAIRARVAQEREAYFEAKRVGAYYRDDWKDATYLLERLTRAEAVVKAVATVRKEVYYCVGGGGEPLPKKYVLEIEQKLWDACRDAIDAYDDAEVKRHA